MATLIIKSNLSQLTEVTINDVGVVIPASGGIETFIENDELYELQASLDLRDFLQDDVHGLSSSTLILNDGVSDIDQADIANFLDSLVLPDGDDDFGVVKTDASGQVATPVTFDGTAGITGLPEPVSAADAATKNYVDTLVSSARTFKELLLSCAQLDSVTDAISRAVPFWVVSNPADSDVLNISDGVSTETFTFLTTPAAAFDVLLGATPADTMTNLVDRINADSIDWSAVLSSELSQLNAQVVVIYRKNQSLSLTDDRIFGTFTTPADALHVDYGLELDYSSSVALAVPAADPGVLNFGLGRTNAELIPNQTHICRDEDTLYTWDSDSNVWQNTGANSPALQDSKYVAKWIHFGVSVAVPNNGTKFLQGPGNVTSSAAALLLPRPGVITSATISADKVDGSRDYKLSIRINGIEVGQLNLLLGTATVFTTALALSYSAGDLLSLALIRTAGSGKSTFKNVTSTIEINEVLS